MGKRGPAKTPMYAAPRYSRPESDTLLGAWLEARGMTACGFARRLDVDPKSVKLWASGQVLPSLVNAFKVEKETGGAVSVSSWLGTERGRLEWNVGKRHT